MNGLTPALAVDYVRELSADVRAVVVLDARGGLLAGPRELEAPARALLEAAAGAGELEAGGPGGVVCAVRSASHAAVAVCGRFAIAGIVRADLRAALAAVEGGSAAAAEAPAAALGGALDRGLMRAAEAPAAAVGGALDRGLMRAAEAPAAALGGAVDRGLMRAAEALISAVQRGFRG